MQNQSTSARTTAKQSSKCSLLFRQAPILAILMLCAVLSTEAQATTSSKDSMLLSVGNFSIGTVSYGTPNEYRYDTISVVLMVSDTLHSNYTPTLNDANYFDKSGAISWVTAFAVRKITIEKKGSHQSGDMMWFNQSDKYYYDTERYLDGNMKPLSKYIKVWMAMSK